MFNKSGLKRAGAVFVFTLSAVFAQNLFASAPDFSAYSPTLNAAVDLAKLKGTPVVLNFWGSWCGPCREEMPALNSVAGEFKGKFMLLAAGSLESAEKSIQYVKDNKYDDLVLLTDPPSSNWGKVDRMLELNDRYKINSYPTSVFIDKNGVIQASRVGGFSRKSLISYLRNIDVTP